MRFCVFLLACSLLPAQAPIRKVYLTGSKQNAIHSGKRMLRFWTCLAAVDRPEEADALVDLEEGTLHFIDHVPDPEPSGFVSCYSHARGASCTDGDVTSVVTCGGRGNGYHCQSYTYDDEAFRAMGAFVREAIQAKITSHAYLLSPGGGTLLWDWDEGLEHPGVSARNNPWWVQLNQQVGCGKTRQNYKKHE